MQGSAWRDNIARKCHSSPSSHFGQPPQPPVLHTAGRPPRQPPPRGGGAPERSRDGLKSQRVAESSYYHAGSNSEKKQGLWTLCICPSFFHDFYLFSVLLCLFSFLFCFLFFSVPFCFLFCFLFFSVLFCLIYLI